MTIGYHLTFKFDSSLQHCMCNLTLLALISGAAITALARARTASIMKRILKLGGKIEIFNLSENNTRGGYCSFDVKRRTYLYP